MKVERVRHERVKIFSIIEGEIYRCKIISDFAKARKYTLQSALLQFFSKCP